LYAACYASLASTKPSPAAMDGARKNASQIGSDGHRGVSHFEPTDYATQYRELNQTWTSNG